MADPDASPRDVEDEVQGLPDETQEVAESESAAEAEDEKKPLSLEVNVSHKGACERHVTVTIPREDIERYLDDAYSELVPKAEVPGFRPGRAPRKLVEGRFRDQIKEQVKGSLLMDSMSQVAEKQDFSAISEPDFDYTAVKLPDEGPMTFEFDIEVRPEFDMPDWKGLLLQRGVHEYTEEEVSERVNTLLERYAQVTPYDGPAEAGDFVVLNITCNRDGKILSKVEEETVRIRPTLSFRDAQLAGFDQLMIGAQEGDVKTAKVQLSDDSDIEELRGQEVDVEFEVLEVKRLELPAMTRDFLDRFGFESEEDLRTAVRQELERQLHYRQSQSLRNQITTQLLAGADWDLPQEMLRRQARRELERAKLELQSAGFSQQEIQAHSNEIQRNSMATTRRALKEHFIFERIAEENAIEPEPEDYDAEIQGIAAASDESPRRVRARIEKRGQMDALRNQIVERKVLQLILSHAHMGEAPLEMEKDETVAVDHALGGRSEAEIPEARYGGEPESLKMGTERG